MRGLMEFAGVNTEDIRQELLKNRIIIKNKGLRNVVLESVKNKRVLDVGVCEHDIEFIKRDAWMHKQVCESSEYCLGIDILEDLILLLNKEGYNCKVADATSQTIDLEERFDIVHVGDVIEHVNNPINLLKFSKRHLKDGGQIFVSTPNPYLISSIFRVMRGSTIVVNPEHVSWITPSLAREIGIRAGLKLTKYFVSHPTTKWKKWLLFWLPIEYKSTNYLYVFEDTNNINKEKSEIEDGE